jgi:hypothetical protein
MLDPRLQKKIDRIGPFPALIECEWDGKAAVAGFGLERFVLLGVGFGREMTAPYPGTRVIASDGLGRTIQCYGMQANVRFRDAGVANQFDATFGSHASAIVVSRVEPLSEERVTTLQALPGWRITRALGPVTELSATSGFTATSKGSSALSTAMANLRRSAALMNANAIVGLTSSAFGAGGGITSAFGGDAVGILLIGTAVVVEALPDQGAASPAGS